MKDTENADLCASLMMYARPELQDAHARYWSLIRTALATRGVETPQMLLNDAPEFDIWLSPGLVFSQTCGLPYRTTLREHVQLVGAPDFALPGCPPGYYNSAVVIRAEETRSTLAAFQDARFAYNQSASQSGFVAAYTLAKKHGFWFSDQHQTGAHVRSARAVAEGRADIAAIDAHTWRLIERYDEYSASLKVLMWTEPTPGTPYICGKHLDANVMFSAVAQAMSQLDPADSAALGLRGLVKIPSEAYCAVPNAPADAV